MRPRFERSVRLSPEEVLARFREASAARRLPCRVNVMVGLAEFSPRRDEHRVWSPYLKLVVNPDPDGREDHAVLDGRFGPNGSLWTFFMGLYAVAFVSGSVALLWAWAQLLMEQRPLAFLFVVLSAVLAGLVWGAGQVGQRLADGQMRMLHDAVMAELADVVEGGEPSLGGS